MRFFVLIICFLLSGCTQNYGTLAKVNGASISIGDFKDRLREIQYEPGLVADEDALNLKKSILNEMIEEKIIQQEFDKTDLSISKEEVNSSMNIENLEETLQKQSMSMDLWKQRIKQKIMAEKLFHFVTKNTQQPSDDEIRETYEKNTELFHQHEQIHAQQIVVKEKGKANEIIKSLAKGEDFSNLARNNSIAMNAESGGELGFLQKGSLPENIEKIIFNLKVGLTSPILESENGFIIIKVLEKKEDHQLSLEEARQQIQTMLFEKAREALYVQWLQDKTIHAKIKRNDELLKKNIHL